MLDFFEDGNLLVALGVEYNYIVDGRKVYQTWYIPPDVDTVLKIVWAPEGCEPTEFANRMESCAIQALGHHKRFERRVRSASVSTRARRNHLKEKINGIRKAPAR